MTLRHSPAPAEPIAVIGIGCRFPGASDLEGFWRLLRDGVDAITEVPADRWDVDALYDPSLAEPGTMNTRWGGFVEGMDAFAASFFGVSAGEASSMDPQHRLLLEVSWEALENAGQAPEALAGSDAGVYVGIGRDDYAQACFPDAQSINAYFAIGNTQCFASNRISNLFDLRGPSVSLDTGCSSALFAVHLACQSLRSGESSLALAGGVNITFSPLATVATSQAWLMAADGRCKSFDASADGYVRSEGCGMVVLKRLADALRDGDPIWGVIRGSAVNQDGRGAGLIIPNPVAQEEVIRRALDEASLSPAQIDYVEAHGVGTKAADIAEARALGAVFGSAPSPDSQGASAPHCVVGSVKTNIGHLENAAGVAALIKVLLSLEHGQIPPNLHFRKLSPEIVASGVTLAIPTEARPWPRAPGRARRAGINSFGLGGANAHLVVEEPPPRVREASTRPLHLLTLSAKSEPALRALAGRYAEHLGSHPEEDFADVCFTANAGRAQLDRRLAVVVASAEEARLALAAFAAGDPAPRVLVGGAPRGSSERSSTTESSPEDASIFLPAPEAGRDAWRAALESLAERYVRGAKLDWPRIEGANARFRLALPTYPFERRRYRLGGAAQPVPGRASSASAPRDGAVSALRERLLAAPPERRREVLAAHVEAEVALALAVEDASRLDRAEGLFAMGMSSLMAIALQSRLQASVGQARALPSTLVFEHPTIAALSDYLAREIFADLVAGAPSARAPLATLRDPAREAPAEEPIAIIGMGCRFPGDANDPDAFFQLMLEGRDAITEIPKSRWDVDAYYSPDRDAPGKMYARCGGFLRDIRGFDAEFFGISPREAAGMDPQHRLLLEVSWEALESAGVPLSELEGSRTGVFVGILGSEYQELRVRRGDLRSFDAYYGTGVIRSAAAGRISYALGLHGPAMAVDTACSSSLVAAHLACRSLRLRECDLALAGGVSLVLSPDGAIFLSRARALAADGRCKTFDASADGYVRSEGCGVVVLKRLSEALADGDEVLAVIGGSAVNQDGPSGGFTVPSGSSQRALIQQALAEACVRPADVSYVEAHGTGTPLGDPIEARALGAVLAEGRPKERPFLLGSVKTNIGHLEAAAGIAGLIKVVLALRNEQIPPHLHLKQQSPRISPDEVPAVIPTQPVPWPAGGARRVAGVSAFGLSGTNAHIVVAEAPPRAAKEPAAESSTRAHLLPLSARSEEALRAMARAYQSFLAEGARGSAMPLRDITATASLRRTHHGHRLAVVGASHDEIRERLGAFLDGEARPGLSAGAEAAVSRPRRLVFVFPGQGSQWPRMARSLLKEEPSFLEAIERCDRALRAHVDWSLLDVLREGDGESRLDAIDVIQPVLFAIEVALAALWASWGVRPDAVIGHSMGEVAAAAVAGALSLEDAALVICRRSRLLRRVSGRGAMAVVDLSMAQAAALLRGQEDRVSIAVSNSPRSTVLSGDPAALAAIVEGLKRDGVFCRPVKVDVASHSPQMDPLRVDLLEALAAVAPKPTTTPLYSTVTGRTSEGASLDAAYWMKNLREPVLFSAAVERALDDGHELFVELSPHPILLPALEQVLIHTGKKGVALPSLRRDQDERAELLASLGALHVAGYPVDFRRIHKALGRPVPLPSYPWQHEPYWFEDAEAEGALPRALSGRRPRGRHPVLGEYVETPSQSGFHLWEVDVDAESLPYLQDHKVHGAVVLPGMAYVSMALSAAEAIFGPGVHTLRDVVFQQALFLPEGAGARTVQTTLFVDGSARATLQIHSRASKAGPGGESDNPWVRHMKARIEQGSGGEASPAADAAALSSIEARCREEVTPADFYRSLEAIGNQFGPRHQGIEGLCRGDGEAFGRVALPSLLAAEAEPYFIHPAFLDACFQVGLAAVPTGDDAGSALGVKTAFMPVRVDRITAYGRPGARLHSHARLVPREGADIVEDIQLRDAEGRVVIEAVGLEGRYLERATETALPTNLEEWLYEIEWRPAMRREAAAVTPGASSPEGAWLIVADEGEGGAGEAIAKLLAERGEESILASPGDVYERVDPRRFRIRLGAAGDMARLLEEAFGRSAVPCRGVMHLLSLGAPTGPLTARDLVEAQRRGCLSVAHLIKAVVQGGRGAPRLWLITRGAHRLEGDSAPPAIAQAPLWGLGRVLAEEHPGLWGGLLDLCPETEPALQAQLLLEQIQNPGGEDQLALRRGHPYVGRLARKPHTAGKARPLRLRADGSYLVTGGLGGIGLEVARWLVEQGARRLILMGRTKLPPRAEWASADEQSPFAPTIAAIRAMESLGASVHLAAVDVGDEAQLGAYLASFRREAWPPIRGVIHAAAVVHDTPLLELDEEVLQADLKPKMVGGYLLHRMTEDDPLDFFVLFSSGSAILSSPFVGAYAAANAFLDALAHHRRALGRTALSVNWGFWAEVGLAARRAKAKDRKLAPEGMGHFTPEQGIEVMKMLLEREAVQVMVAPVNWQVWGRFHPTGARAPLLAELIHQRSKGEDPAPTKARSAPPLRQELLAIEPGFRRRGALETYLQEQVGQVLRLSPSKVGLNKPIGSLGLDSLMGLELRNRFEASTGLSLPATLIWTYPTVTDLANHLAAQMGIPLAPPAEPPKVPPPADGGPPELEDMSEESAEALLAEALAMVQQRRSNG